MALGIPDSLKGPESMRPARKKKKGDIKAKLAEKKSDRAKKVEAFKDARQEKKKDFLQHKPSRIKS